MFPEVITPGIPGEIFARNFRQRLYRPIKVLTPADCEFFERSTVMIAS
jgi:hypothetical protein